MFFSITAIALLASAVSSLSADQGQPTDHSLAMQIVSDDAAERGRALEAAKAIGLGDRSSEFRMALITALERESALHRRRYDAVRADSSPVPLEDPELLGRLSKAVAELHDPASIPALAGALGTGFTVIRALASFGQPAAGPVLAVVTSPDSIPDAVNHGLITLRFMVEETGMRPLSAATMAAIRKATAVRLQTGKGLWLTTLWWAMDLASVLGDAELRHEVQSMATDRDAVIALGVEDPALVDATQKRAADRLAGIPPLPRP